MPVTRNAHTGLPMGPVTVMTPILPMGPASDHPASAAADTATEAGEGEGEGDDRTYCFCDGVSYGQMIACDDHDCEREWVRFHLALSQIAPDCGPTLSFISVVSASRRSRKGPGSAMCAEPSKKTPGALPGVAKSALVAARDRAGKLRITLDILYSTVLLFTVIGHSLDWWSYSDISRKGCYLPWHKKIINTSRLSYKPRGFTPQDWRLTIPSESQ